MAITALSRPAAKPEASKPAAMSPASFLAGLESRGLSVELNETGEALRLFGPRDKRTDRIRNYLRSQKTELIAHLMEQRRADLVREFGEELVAEGLAVEEDLLRQAAAGEHDQSAGAVAVDDGEDGEEDDRDIGDTDEDRQEYGDLIRAAYQAAVAGAMPRVSVELGPGRAVSDPNFFLKTLVDQAKLLKAAHGEDWRDRPECNRICCDIETIATWYQGWYWSQPEHHELLLPAFDDAPADASDASPAPASVPSEGLFAGL